MTPPLRPRLAYHLGRRCGWAVAHSCSAPPPPQPPEMKAPPPPPPPPPSTGASCQLTEDVRSPPGLQLLTRKFEPGLVCRSPRRRQWSPSPSVATCPASAVAAVAMAATAAAARPPLAGVDVAAATAAAASPPLASPVVAAAADPLCVCSELWAAVSQAGAARVVEEPAVKAAMVQAGAATAVEAPAAVLL